MAISTRMSAGLASLFLTTRIDRVSITIYYNLVLPVHLQAFTAKASRNTVDLAWTTAYEFNSDHYKVQRTSSSIGEWQTVAEVKAAGSSQVKKQYNWIDNNPGSMNYYRLVQVDRDGRESISHTVLAKIFQTRSDVFVYPNPVISELFIESDEAIQSAILYDCYGRTISVSLQIQNAYRCRLDCQDVPAGIYFLHILGKKKSKQIPIVVQ